ncbi:DEAD-box ATP-dependent RNA helicase CshA [Calidithermus terrae]|uniref:DEAD-box ATP-dependent RNA helicase CshA n=1 Tax=Calidithermus terrae TaxID=1408545 RepID=A0A399F5R3_9DEIN|nr:DEAD/DEAH box helicase [Calidithermus terrae]RIH90609.1 DEAD-box ATP-dependent RNA helicase CshA [Calidithermus terrae]
MEFSAFPLKAEVLAALQAKGFSTPTPIQAAALPLALEGRDILGQARTGTGKTLAFALPIANRLEPARERGRAPRAFVLAPTRELALQVAKELEWIARDLAVVTVYGGTGYGKQAEALKRGCDVVVATPGRAIDYLEQGILDLSKVQIAVLDEADEMLSMGFEEDVEKLLQHTPDERQTLLFSATVPAWAKRLADRYLKNFVHVNVIKDERVSYEELALQAPLQTRLATLSDLLYAYSPERSIVFTRTKAEADEVALGLQARALPAAAIHGDMSQRERELVMGRFRSGQDTVLVATDVAARGLDIPEVDLVVHYRLPEQAESYQHRSGRTGRAGRSGRVIILYGPRERRDLEQLEREVSRKFRRINPPTPEEVMEAKWRGLLNRLTSQPAADRALWREYAARLVAEGELEAVAGMLALLLGGAPASKSLITGEEGLVTVKLTGPRLSVPRVVAVLKKAGAGRIGRILLTDSAAYLDLPGNELEAVQSQLTEFHLSRAHEVPAEAGAGAREERSRGRSPEGRERRPFERRRPVAR